MLYNSGSLNPFRPVFRYGDILKLNLFLRKDLFSYFYLIGIECENSGLSNPILYAMLGHFIVSIFIT